MANEQEPRGDGSGSAVGEPEGDGNARAETGASHGRTAKAAGPVKKPTPAGETKQLSSRTEKRPGIKGGVRDKSGGPRPGIYGGKPDTSGGPKRGVINGTRDRSGGPKRGLVQAAGAAISLERLFENTPIPKPSTRPLKVYAFDPSHGHVVGNCMCISIRYDDELKRGPVGERFAVIDYDSSTEKTYPQVSLDDKDILISGGLDPNEADQHFHQQMVYAVANETLERFELALGRRLTWEHMRNPPQKTGEATATEDRELIKEWKRLLIYPHAMAEANAYYSRQDKALLFGYFRASSTNPGRNLPGQTVFTCLSHDIIAHETTHAIVDGIRSYFLEPTNIDVSAFHEAFADIAALFAHFSYKDAVLDTIEKTGGRLFSYQLEPEAGTGADGVRIQAQMSKDNPLVQLAMQFGQAAGMRTGLRSALGTRPDCNELATTTEPHDRGAILVAAVFDAYFTVYTKRAANLFRIFRAGGGREDLVDLPKPLAEMLAALASKTAQQFFVICVRALDYCPPVDITFGDYLRAIITADLDLHPQDPEGIRDAFIQAFRLRGIVPEDAAFFSEGALCWGRRDPVKDRDLFVKNLWFGNPNGLTPKARKHNIAILERYGAQLGPKYGFEKGPGAAPIKAESLQPLIRIAPDGRLFVNMIVELVQTKQVEFGADVGGGTFPMRNAVTLIIANDEFGRHEHPWVLFAIPKPCSSMREARIRAFHIANGLAGQKDEEAFRIDFARVHAGR